jgi:3-methyladenine DNA glycosylase AlkC
VRPAAARDCLEEFMTTTAHRYQSEFASRYYSQGEAKALLAILDARGIQVPDEVRETITGCTDLDQLEAWIRRAATADKIQDLDEHFTGL